MPDIKTQASKMLAEEIVRAIKKMTDDNNKQYVNNQIKNYQYAGSSGSGGLVSAGNITNLGQALVDFIGKGGEVTSAVVNAIIGNFDKVIADTVVAEEIYASYGEFIRLVAEEGKFEKVHSDIADIGLANIGNAKIGYAQIEGLTANTALIQEGVGGKLYIADLAVTDAQILSLSVGNLVLKDPETGELCLVTVSTNDETGERELNFEPIPLGSVPGGSLINESIESAQLGPKCVTFEKIDVDSLFANNILANRITAGDIQAGQIDAGHIAAGTIGVSHLTSQFADEFVEENKQSFIDITDEAIGLSVQDTEKGIGKIGVAADKIYWLIDSSSGNKSEMRLTEEAIKLISKNIELTAEQINIVIKDLDFSENESIENTIENSISDKSTVYRDEAPPSKANKNDLWVQPSTGYTYQLAENDSNALPAFYLDGEGIMYYEYGSDQTVYELQLDTSGDLYISSEAPFAVSISENGRPLVWLRVKDSQLEQEIEDAKTELTENITNVQTEIKAEIGTIQTTISGVTDNAKELQTQITQNAEKISTQASRIDKNANAVEKHESSITQMANSITSKVSQTTYETDKNDLIERIEKNESSITQTATDINLHVTNEVNNLNGRISKNESDITLLDTSITSKVSQEAYDEELGVVRDDISEIRQTATNIRLEVSKKTATFSQEDVPTPSAEGDIWIQPSTGKVAKAVKHSSGALIWQKSSLTPDQLKTSSIEIAQDHINIASGGNVNINAGANFNVNAGAAHFRTKEYTLSIPADENSEDTVMDFDADSKTLRVTEIEAGNVRPYISGATPVYSDQIGGLEGLKGMLESAQYERVIYTQTGKDMSSEEIVISGSNSLNVQIVGSGTEPVQIPPLHFSGITGNVTLENLKWSTQGTAVTADSGDIAFHDCYMDAGTGIRALWHARVLWVGTVGTTDALPTAGECDTAASAEMGAEIKLYGMIPAGGLTESRGGRIIAVDTVYGSGSTVEEPTTQTLDATVGYYGTNNGWVDGELRQGYSNGKGKIYGCMKFDLPSGATDIQSAQLRLHRVKGTGKGSAVDVVLYGSRTAFGSRPSTDILYVEREDAADPGVSISLDVTAAVQHLANGTIAQLVLYNGDTNASTGKVYSSNYALFDKAALKITY